MEQPAIGSDII